MEENKNLNPELEAETAEAEDFDIAEAVKGEKKSKKAKKDKKPKKEKAKKIKNQALLKRGSYSLAITAAVVAGAIILNILVGALTDRFVLEFDMSLNKDNSISEENIEYIKGIEDKVTVTVCADEETYSSYMGYYAQQYYSVSDDAATSYYDQTVTLVNKYADYNKNITVNFVDTQSTKFTEISSKYSSEKLMYGDIIISTEKDGAEKHKIISYDDIYYLDEDTTYASYGMSFYTVSGNNIETALTSAISYVTSDKIKRAAIITGHSATDYTATYQTLLKDNNYETEIISDSLVTEISSEYDLVVIPCPSTDFIGTELDAVSEFLDNDGKLGKGLIFVADVTAPYLTNLYDFLEQWGIVVEDGILFETNSSNHMADDPTTLGSYTTEADDILSGMSVCITGYNAPMYAGFESEGGITVTSFMETPDSVVAAPKGVDTSWTEADNYETDTYSTVIQAAKSDYDEDNNPITSYVTAFSSTHFLESEYSEYSSVSNKDVLFAVSERGAGADKTDISFVSKYIDEESFADQVTEASSNTMRIIFMIILPIICIAAGIYIYIKRRNA
ncbi:MAG: GldG family protein [Acutalibacteraceae bacterium]|nr:GldG family protein [Acutalibacteraceae bacterium]